MTNVIARRIDELMENVLFAKPGSWRGFDGP